MKKKLKNNINNLNKIKNIDHKMINKKMDLYHINDNSPGMIFWHYKGLIILENIKKLLRKKLIKYNYYEVNTAFLINKNMWIKSGHWKNYKKYIFYTKKKKYTYCVKPMNCIGHIDIYKQKIRSYKNLPLRYAEFGTCHRNENSGSLNGLMRTRCFIQDDAHIFCLYKQINKEISKCINMIIEIYKIFNFNNIYIYISTRPKKYLGKSRIWNILEKKLINILNKKKIKFSIKKGQGAFYGPKIEFVLKDSLKRKWQCGTIQLDFFLPKKFKINYLNKINIKKTPIIIHRAILGSLERFIAIIIEETKGLLPLWLTPIQVVVMNISKKYKKYSNKIFNKLKKNNIRTISDFRNKNINFKIREYTLQKIPYMVVCGDKELKSNKISIRTLLNKKLKNIYLKDLIKKIKKYTKI